MSQKNTPLPLTTRADEDRYLSETLEVVKANTADYSRQAAQMKADIDDMLEHYHDNDMESLTELNNTVTLYEHVKTALEHNTRALAKPYFGRIIFQDKTFHCQESLYIGRGGISRDTIHPVVIDWRAPVANVYYESSLGECSYTAPGSQEMPIDLQLKRTYEIEDGKLKNYFDSEVIANDELLTRYLARNKQAVLSEIVATIQKEQNEIIRLTPYRNLIVQGVAGSGKTTVAMHRISYILYNYAERFKPEDFYIVGSNRILLNYITGVLPDLDVNGVKQMTMAQLFVRLLYEEWDEKKYRISGSVRDNIRGKLAWFEDLKKFCSQLEWNYISRKDVCLDTDVPQDNSRILLLSQEAIEKYIRENPALSMQSKIDGLNERLMARLHNHFLEHMGKYTEDERKEIQRTYRRWFGGKKMKLSIFDLYDRFLTEQRHKWPEGHQRSGRMETVSSVTSPPEIVTSSKPVRRVTEFDVYDLAALAYLYARVQETEVIQEAHHVVIDEAQDFGMMAYASLSHCLRGCTYTIMGDVSQNIRFGSGLNDWEELKALLLKDPADSFRILKKSYRNTIEISEYALRILRHGRFSVYPVEPIIRHGKPVQEILIEPPHKKGDSSGTLSAEEKIRIRNHLIRKAAQILGQWQSEGYNTLAVVCRDSEKASCAAKELGKYINVCGDDLENAVFSEGIMVLPVEYTKGLEFDAVLLLDPTAEEYPLDDGHAKLLYVAATRALHELCVIHSGSLTSLITEEPGSTVTEYEDDTGDRTAAFQKKTKADPTTLFFASGKSLQMPDQYDSETILKKARQASPAQPVGSAQQTDKRQSSIRTDSTPTQPVVAPIQPVLTPASASQKLPAMQPAAAPTPAASSPEAAVQKAAQASAPGSVMQKNTPSSRPRFGDVPADAALQQPGHSKIDLAVRWVSRQADGLCLQSRYGVLRLSPVTSRIVRVSFAKLGQLDAAPHPKIVVSHMDNAWMYREIGGSVELLTDDLCLHVDKTAGTIQYMTRDRKPLAAESPKDCRVLEAAGNVSLSAWINLRLDKKELLTALDPGPAAGSGKTVVSGKVIVSDRAAANAQTEQITSSMPDRPERIPLRGRACFISPEDPDRPFPLIISDRGYALMPASGSPVIFCDLPAYGSYIRITKCAQMDFYFLLGDENECLSAYRYLCGR